jgi:hypothetical protein
MVGRSPGFTESILVIKSLRPLLYVAVIDGKDPCKIFIAKAL